MDWEMVEENWMQIRGAVKVQWGGLTDAHLETIGGRRITLVGYIAETCGITADDAEQQVERVETADRHVRQRFLRTWPIERRQHRGLRLDRHTVPEGILGRASLIALNAFWTPHP